MYAVKICHTPISRNASMTHHYMRHTAGRFKTHWCVMTHLLRTSDLEHTIDSILLGSLPLCLSLLFRY